MLVCVCVCIHVNHWLLCICSESNIVRRPGADRSVTRMKGMKRAKDEREREWGVGWATEDSTHPFRLIMNPVKAGGGGYKAGCHFFSIQRRRHYRLRFNWEPKIDRQGEVEKFKRGTRLSEDSLQLGLSSSELIKIKKSLQRVQDLDVEF